MSDAVARKNCWLATVCGAVVMGLPGLSAHAHHSFAMYDQAKQETYTGKLVRFIPGANHAQLLFEIVDAEGKLQVGADGKPITWGVELGDRRAFGLEGHQHQLLLRARALKQRGRRDAKLLGDHGHGCFGPAVDENLARGHADLAIADLSTASHSRA